MKIAIVLPIFLPVPAVNGGAIESLVQKFIEQNEISKNNIEISIFSPFEKQAVILSKKFIKTNFVWIKYHSVSYILLNFFIRVIRRFFRLSINYRDIQIIKKILEKGNFNYIIIEGNTRHLITFSKYFDKKKLILHVHANIFTESNEENDKIINGCNKIISVSQFVKNMILKNTKAEDGQVSILRNCTDIKLFDKKLYNEKQTSLRNKYHIKDDDVVILFVGRIIRSKGVVELFTALKLLKKNAKFKLLIVGSFGSNFGLNNAKSDLSDVLSELSYDFKEKIIYAGYIPNKAMPEICSMSDIAVIPSICEDAAPLVLLESLSTGLPLLVTNSGGMPEYVTEHCAVIIKRDESLIKNLALALEKLIYDSELRKYMGQESRKHALQYSTENYYNNLLKIISD